MEENTQEASQVCTEDMNNKISELYDKIQLGIDSAFSNTAQRLEATADKIYDTADYIRAKNADTLKTDVVTLVEKHPVQSITVAFIGGFLVGKILSK